MTRQELQNSVARVLERERRVICQWATGVGKSQVALNFLRNNPGTTCLILVPEQNNIANWITEFDKFDVSPYGVEIACYASFKKYENTSWGLLVFDEAPHVDTDIRREICRTVSGEYVLALGAVITDEEKAALENAYGHFQKSIITLEHAIRNGFLPMPKVNVCHISIDRVRRRYWYRGMSLSAKGMYDILEQKVEEAKAAFSDNQTKMNKLKMFSAGVARKRFLGEIKEDAVRYICNGLQNKNRRFLCFCASIKQAESLCKERAFTSKTPTSAKLLEKFNNKEINSLFVVGKLIEGQNLVDIEHGVITQLGGTERITVQSIGRIMRSKNPVIWIPVFDGTKDDSFLNGVTANIPDIYISHYKL